MPWWSSPDAETVVANNAGLTIQGTGTTAGGAAIPAGTVAAAGNINLVADQGGQVNVSSSGIDYVWGVAYHDGTTASATTTSAAEIDGVVQVGLGRQLELVLGPDGTPIDKSDAITVSAPELVNLGAFVQARIDQLDQLIALASASPSAQNAAAIDGYQAEIGSLRQQLATLGAGSEIMAVTVAPMTTQLGNIYVAAGTLHGAGALETPQDSGITIINNGPTFMTLQGLAIGSGDGKVYFNGINVTDNAGINALNSDRQGANFSFASGTANGATPGIMVESNYDPLSPLYGGAGYQALVPAQETPGIAPDIILQGNITNPGGTVTIQSAAGNIRLEQPTDASGNLLSSQGASINAGSVSISATRGDFTQTCSSSSGAGTGIVANGDVVLSAQVLDINGTIQSGIPEWGVEVPANATVAIPGLGNGTFAQAQAYYDSLSPAAKAAPGAGLFVVTGATVTGLGGNVQGAWQQIPVFYNCQGNNLQVNGVQVQGGYIQLNGQIVNTNPDGGLLRVLDGYGQIKIDNQTLLPIWVNQLNTGSGAQGTVVINDIQDGPSGQQVVTTTFTRDGGARTGAGYDPAAPSNPIGIQYLGFDTGTVGVVSSGSVVLEGAITNRTGDTSVLSQQGSIIQNGSQPVMTGANVTLAAGLGLGTPGQALQVSVNSGGTLDAIATSGDAYLQQVSGTSGPGLINLNAKASAGQVEVTADGPVNIYALSAAAQVVLTADGPITGSGVASTGGPVDVNSVAGSITIGTVAGTAVTLAAQGNVSAGMLSGSSGAVDVASTAGAVNVGTAAGTGVRLAALGDVTAGTLAGGNGAVSVDSTNGAVNVGTAAGMGVSLAASGNVAATGLAGGSGFVSVSSVNGAVNVGTAAGTGVSLAASGNVTATSIAGGSGFVSVSSTNGAVDVGTAEGTGVSLAASGNVTATSIAGGSGFVGVDSTNGAVDIGTAAGTGVGVAAPGDVTATDLAGGSGAVNVASAGTISVRAATGTGVSLNALEGMTAGTLTGGSGAVNANSTAGAVSIGTAAGTGVNLTALDDVAATSLDGGSGALNVVSASGSINIGIAAGTGVGLAASGKVIAASLAGRSGAVIVTSTGGAISIGGAVGTGVSLAALGDVTAGALAGGNGAVNLNSAAGTVSVDSAAGTAVTLAASGNVSAGMLSAGNGPVNVNSTDGAVNVGTAAGTGVSLTALAEVTAGTVAGGTGAVGVGSTEGAVNIGTATGTGVKLGARGDVTAGSLTGGSGAVSVSSVDGAVEVGYAAGTGVSLAALEDVAAGTLNAAGGNVAVSSTLGGIQVDAVSGNVVTLTALVDVAGDTITSQGATGAVNVRSTAGAIDLGTVTGAEVSLSAEGNVTGTALTSFTANGGVSVVSTAGGIAVGTATGNNLTLSAAGSLTGTTLNVGSGLQLSANQIQAGVIGGSQVVGGSITGSKGGVAADLQLSLSSPSGFAFTSLWTDCATVTDSSGWLSVGDTRIGNRATFTSPATCMIVDQFDKSEQPCDVQLYSAGAPFSFTCTGNQVDTDAYVIYRGPMFEANAPAGIDRGATEQAEDALNESEANQADTRPKHANPDEAAFTQIPVITYSGFPVSVEVEEK